MLTQYVCVEVFIHVHLILQKGVNTYIVKTKFNDVMVVLWATSISMKSNS